MANFVKDLHNQLKKVSHERAFFTKIYPKVKTAEQVQLKLTKKLVGMRRGTQFNFTKLPKTEILNHNTQLSDKDEQDSLASDSSMVVSKVSSVASL